MLHPRRCVLHKHGYDVSEPGCTGIAAGRHSASLEDPVGSIHRGGWGLTQRSCYNRPMDIEERFDYDATAPLDVVLQSSQELDGLLIQDLSYASTAIRRSLQS